MTEQGGLVWLVVGVAGGLALAVVVVAVILPRRPGGGRLDAEVARLSSVLGTALTEFGEVRRGVEVLYQAQAELRGQVQGLGQRVETTTAGLADKTFQAQSLIQREIVEAQKLVQEVRTELAERKRRDEEVERAVRHLEAVLAGSPTKGAAGENILDEAFSSFPAGMVERNFRVRGKVVEYALVLTGTGRRLPIDSKWPATQAFETLANEADPAARKKAAAEVRTILRQRVREVAQYLDPASTTDEAIAAVPDAAYPLCGEITFEAYRQGVIIMPYSMIVPYVLHLYSLHLKYSRSVDLDSLDHALSDIERSVDALDKVLENSIQRGATMIGNAYDEVRRIADQIRRSLVYVRALPAVSEGNALGAGEAQGAAGPAEEQIPLLIGESPGATKEVAASADGDGAPGADAGRGSRRAPAQRERTGGSLTP